jgi:uncharacterized membrane protein YbhN (UPF0104 family)
VGVAAVVVVVTRSFRGVDRRALRQAIADAALLPIALAMLLNLVGRTWARARRTLALLRGLPEGRIRFVELVRLVVGAHAAGLLFWSPAEEVLSTVALSRRHGFRLRALLSTQVLDKSLGVMSVAVLALLALPTRGTLRLPLLAGAALVAAVAGALAIRSWRADPAARSGRDVIEAFGWMLVSNLLNVVIIGLCLRAAGVRLGATACARVFVASTCANALPSLPAQIGVIETTFIVALGRLGVAPSTALAVGLIYHLCQVLPFALAGLPVLIRLPRSAVAQAHQPPRRLSCDTRS